MDTILLYLHSWVRWAVVIVMIMAIGYAIYALVNRHAYTRSMERIMRVFSSMIGLQWFLGILLLVIQGQFDIPYRWEHAATMTGALIVAHLYIPFKKRSDITRYGVVLAVMLGVALLVYIGVARLPQGWRVLLP